MNFLIDLKGKYFYEDLHQLFIDIPPLYFSLLFDHEKFVPTSKEIESITQYMINVPELKSKDIINKLNVIFFVISHIYRY